MIARREATAPFVELRSHAMIVALLLSMLCYHHASAQEDKTLFHEAVGVQSPKHDCALVQAIPAKSVENLIDVLSYDVFVDLYDGLLPLDSTKSTPWTYRASVDIRLVVMSDTLRTIPLHLDGLTIRIDTVTINKRRTTFDRWNNRTVFAPTFVFQKGDTLTMHLAYHVTRVPGGGLTVVNGKEQAEVQGSYPIAFTFTEPENSRRWFPCNDVPNDKALFRARVRMPMSNRLVSNGELQLTTHEGDSAKTETWSCPDAMPTYLFAINVSNFVQLFQLYSREGGTGVPIRNFHWDTDINGPLRAPFAVRNVPEMFRAFEGRYGKYPFSTYGHVAIHPVAIGGMEHQTMTTVNRKWLEGNAEVGYAHELGHQWFGDAVTCATWGDIWLNEGGATFSEAVWREHQEGEAGYRDQMMRRRETYLKQGLNAPAVWDIPIGNLFNDPTTYAKSSWIFHMMRRMLGDEVFFDNLKLYLSTYRGQSIQTAVFEQFWKDNVSNPLVSWEVFFDQWLVQRGHPVLRSRIRHTASDTTHTFVRIEQIQDVEGVPREFQFPLRVELYSKGERVGEYAYTMKSRWLEFQQPKSLQIDSVKIDPDLHVLHEIHIDTVVSVADDTRTSSATSNLMLHVLGAHPVARGNDVLMGIDINAGIMSAGPDASAEFDATERGAILRITDMRGAEVWRTTVAVHQNVVRIPHALLDTGAYVATLLSQAAQTSTRFIVY